MGSQILQKLESWQQFKDRVAPLETKGKGDAFELLVKYYLQIDPQYKTKLKSVWLLDEVSIELKEKLNLPDQDKGIDIIAETFEREYWSIQCKYRDDEDSSITWDELSTFTGLSFGVCKNISFGLICTTTNRVTDTLSGQDNIGFCTGEVWRNLDSDFLSQLNSLIEHKPISIKPLTPRPHQISAIENAKNHFIKEASSRGKMIMPCGTGKSMVAYWIAEELQAKNIIVAVPSLALIRQSLKAWLRESVANNRKIKWICVASDETVGKIRRDDIAVLKQDLGVPAYTDSDKIAEWLELNDDSIKVVFTTYQSGKAISEASKKTNFVFDLGIMDEAHKTVGSKSKLFSYLLFDDNIRIEQRLFMTATERRYAGSSDEILSMDDEEIYGNTFELLTFKDALAIKPPVLSDYKIVTITVDKEEVKELIENNTFVIPDKENWNEDIGAKTLASNIALQRAFEDYPINHAVSFHSSIGKAKSFQKTQSKYSTTFKTETNLSTYHVSGKIPTSIRDKIIKEFESNPPSLITNARCLSVGVDVPNIDCILFADSKKSRIDIVQSAGRALRIYEGKEYAYIIIPIITDTNNIAGDLIDGEAFNEVLTTLIALASNDERIIEYFSSITKRKEMEGFINFQINEKIGKRIDSQKFIESIQLRVWDKLAKLSWMQFDEAREFVSKLNLRSQFEWRDYINGKYKSKVKIPPNIPRAPNYFYLGKGWEGWKDFLGSEYLNYEEARKFVRGLGLKSTQEWHKYIKGFYPTKPHLPENIPKYPVQVYKENGWTGIKDWLGYEYRDFIEARKFARSLNLSGVKEWLNYTRGLLKNKLHLPSDIPSSPSIVYKDQGWKNIQDWLGTGMLGYEEAKEFVKGLGLTTSKEWSDYATGGMKDKPPKPRNIPSFPYGAYNNKGWKGMKDWLGTDENYSSDNKIREFNKARDFIRSLNLKSEREWTKYIRGELKSKPPVPEGIPKNPAKSYKDVGWVGMFDWLGLKYLDHKKAKDFVEGLGLKSEEEWEKYVEGKLIDKPPKPDDIPAEPQIIYRYVGWQGWDKWLSLNQKYLSYVDAKKIIHKLKLNNLNEWKLYVKGVLQNKSPLPSNIPANPHSIYCKSYNWKGYDDWLGLQYLKYNEAEKFAKTLGLKSRQEWIDYVNGKLKSNIKKPCEIPDNPQIYYKNIGWKSWPHWLGNEYLDYEIAREFSRKLGLNNQSEWLRYAKGEFKDKPPLPKNIPSGAQQYYHSYHGNKGWLGWGDWLGTGNVAIRKINYREFEDARKLVRSLGLKNGDEWKKFPKEILPNDIPKSPWIVYKGKGWKGMKDWLGTAK